MTELFEAVASWKSLLLVVAAFGFAPGFVLRLLVKIYPREDPRRREIVAQLYVLGRTERPFFVAEQIETALFDGLGPRVAKNWRQARDKLYQRKKEKVRRRMRVALMKDQRIPRFPPHFSFSSPSVNAIAQDSHTGGRLLVLGQAGVGKTTLALELTRQLLLPEPLHEPARLPLFMRIAEWDADSVLLRDYMLTELKRYWKVRNSTARRILNDPHLIPILDGFDELPPIKGQAAVRQLNENWHDRKIVVTSRSSEYQPTIHNSAIIFLDI